LKGGSNSTRHVTERLVVRTADSVRRAGAVLTTHGLIFTVVGLALAPAAIGGLGLVLGIVGAGYWAVSGAESYVDCAQRIKLLP
jgi:hypothetical protein